MVFRFGRDLCSLPKYNDLVMKQFPALVLCGLILTACGGTHPTQLIKRVDFSAPTATLVGKIDAVQFLTPADDRSVNERATSATFYVGDRRYPGKRLGDNVTWEYVTVNPCQDLPQGNSIKARYEFVDASKTVLAGKEQLLTRIDTCR